MREKIIALIEAETGIFHISEITPIDALEIDSLEYIHLLQSIRNHVGKVDVDHATAAQTVGDLIAAVG